MGLLKSSILLPMVFIGFVNTALAEIEAPRLILSKDEFLRSLPAETDKVLPYLFEKFSLGDSYGSGLNTTYNVKIVDQVSDGKIMDIKPRFGNDRQLHFDFYLQRSLSRNPVYVLEVLGMLQTFFKDSVKLKSLQDPGLFMEAVLPTLGIKEDGKIGSLVLQWAETKVNADRGSAYALQEMKRNQLSAVDNSMMSFQEFSLLKSLTEEQRKIALLEMAQVKRIPLKMAPSADEMAMEYFTQEKERVQKELDAATQKGHAQYARERKYLDSLEVKDKKKSMEGMTQKLDDMVKANDRQGVAKLLEAFLPLEIMEPMEKAMWKNWLEAIRHPDRENAALMFRGLDTENDKPQIVYDAQKKPVGYGYFSTMLSRNQGSYTRRLRSLVGMRYRFMNIQAENAELSPIEVMPSVGNMMKRHSSAPEGSPLLSFTTDPNVAFNFSVRGLLAVKIDQRRFLPNMVSAFPSEVELLVPLIIFPDEVVHMQDYEKQARYGVNTFLSEVNKKLGHSYTLDIETDQKKLLLGAYRIFAEAQNFIGGQCRAIFQ